MVKREGRGKGGMEMKKGRKKKKKKRLGLSINGRETCQIPAMWLTGSCREARDNVPF